jgi:hypothetical protein
MGSVEQELDLVVAFSVAESKAALFDALDRARVAYESLREDRGGRPASRVELMGNIPNPFNPRTTMRYALPSAASVAIDLFDVRGRKVRRLLDAPMPSGFHRIDWDGRDDRGAEVASGVYFVRLRAGSVTRTRRVALVR